MLVSEGINGRESLKAFVHAVGPRGSATGRGQLIFPGIGSEGEAGDQPI